MSFQGERRDQSFIRAEGFWGGHLTRDQIAERQVDSSICDRCGTRRSIGCNHPQGRFPLTVFVR